MVDVILAVLKHCRKTYHCGHVIIQQLVIYQQSVEMMMMMMMMMMAFSYSL
jgi:hypothetical protein